MNLWLFGGLACLAAWLLLTFVMPAGSGLVHLLLGIGLVSLVVWWGKRPAGANPAP